MRTVSNTSPLIWLSNMGKLNLLKELFDEILIPPEVYREAVETGLQEGFSDALIIKEAVDQGWIKTTTLGEKEIELCHNMMKHAFELHMGEAQAIALARRMGKDTLLLIDESSGSSICGSLGTKSQRRSLRDNDVSPMRFIR